MSQSNPNAVGTVDELVVSSSTAAASLGSTTASGNEENYINL